MFKFFSRQYRRKIESFVSVNDIGASTVVTALFRSIQSRNFHSVKSTLLKIRWHICQEFYELYRKFFRELLWFYLASQFAPALVRHWLDYKNKSFWGVESWVGWFKHDFTCSILPSTIVAETHLRWFKARPRWHVPRALFEIMHWGSRTVSSSE